MKISVSDPKTKKAYALTTEDTVFLNKKIGESVDLSGIGLVGYKGQITGGSDKQGFPMKPTFPGESRKKLLMTSGIGFNPKVDGEKRRKRVRGNIISEQIEQLNVKVTDYGKKPLEDLLKKEESKETEEKKE